MTFLYMYKMHFDHTPSPLGPCHLWSPSSSQLTLLYMSACLSQFYGCLKGHGSRLWTGTRTPFQWLHQGQNFSLPHQPLTRSKSWRTWSTLPSMTGRWWDQSYTGNSSFSIQDRLSYAMPRSQHSIPTSLLPLDLTFFLSLLLDVPQVLGWCVTQMAHLIVMPFLAL